MGKSKISASDTTQLGILDLLKVRGFDPNCKAKLVRHQDKRYDVQQLIRDDWIDLYQAHQAKDMKSLSTSSPRKRTAPTLFP